MPKKKAGKGDPPNHQAEGEELRRQRRVAAESIRGTVDSLQRQADAEKDPMTREEIMEQIQHLDRIQQQFSAAGMRLETLMYPDLDGQRTVLRSLLYRRRDYVPNAEEFACLINAVDNGEYKGGDFERLHAQAALAYLLERDPPSIKKVRELAYKANTNESAELRDFARQEIEKLAKDPE